MPLKAPLKSGQIELLKYNFGEGILTPFSAEKAFLRPKIDVKCLRWGAQGG